VSARLLGGLSAGGPGRGRVGVSARTLRPWAGARLGAAGAYTGVLVGPCGARHPCGCPGRACADPAGAWVVAVPVLIGLAVGVAFAVWAVTL